MAAEGLVVLLILALALFAPVGLYMLVRSEHNRPTMDRKEAEQVARADGERHEPADSTQREP